MDAERLERAGAEHEPTERDEHVGVEQGAAEVDAAPGTCESPR